MMLEVESLNVRKSDGQPIIHDLTFNLNSGEILAICGPSGCGKSTLLNAIAGFIEVKKTSSSHGWSQLRERWFRIDRERLAGTGQISYLGQDLSACAPQDRDIGLVLQRYGFYPNLTGFANIAFPLKCRGESQTEIDKAVDRAANLVGLGPEELSRRAGTLSGGQAQRLAIAKMLAKNSPIALLDEPFAHLDQVRRSELVGLMRELVDREDEVGFRLALLVSHEWSEAKIADKILLLNARDDHRPSERLLIRSSEGRFVLKDTGNQLEIDKSEETWISGLTKGTI